MLLSYNYKIFRCFKKIRALSLSKIILNKHKDNRNNGKAFYFKDF